MAGTTNCSSQILWESPNKAVPLMDYKKNTQVFSNRGWTQMPTPDGVTMRTRMQHGGTVPSVAATAGREDRAARMPTTLKRSLFRNERDARDCMALLKVMLERPSQYGLTHSINGLCHLADLVEALQEDNLDFDYLTSAHLIECYLREPEEMYRLEEGLLGLCLDNKVSPPGVLYFGTVESFRARMSRRGIMSQSRRYIKLYDTEEAALGFSVRFSSDGDPACTLTIDAASAYRDGVDFSASAVEGEYFTAQISPRYILGAIDPGEQVPDGQ